ncbi:gtp binding protein [Moniliophthora roreri]|nr:gtp binding protein [Moniliophthora roreri]
MRKKGVAPSGSPAFSSLCQRITPISFLTSRSSVWLEVEPSALNPTRPKFKVMG